MICVANKVYNSNDTNSPQTSFEECWMTMNGITTPIAETKIWRTALDDINPILCRFFDFN